MRNKIRSDLSVCGENPCHPFPFDYAEQSRVTTSPYRSTRTCCQPLQRVTGGESKWRSKLASCPDVSRKKVREFKQKVRGILVPINLPVSATLIVWRIRYSAPILCRCASRKVSVPFKRTFYLGQTHKWKCIRL